MPVGEQNRRCFLALGIDDLARQAIAKLQRQLGDIPRQDGRIKTVDRANLHLTLKFLGETGPQQLSCLLDQLPEVAAQTTGFSASLRGLGAFPSERRPRAVFAAVDTGASSIITLAERIETICVELGFTPESRPRIPHVTIARIKEARSRGSLTTFIEAHVDSPKLGKVDASRLLLYESQLHASGSRYRIIESFAFPPSPLRSFGAARED